MSTAQPYSQQNSLGVTYWLNHKKVTLSQGGISSAYFFTREPRYDTGIPEVPQGKEVVESSRSHILVLRNKR